MGKYLSKYVLDIYCMHMGRSVVHGATQYKQSLFSFASYHPMDKITHANMSNMLATSFMLTGHLCYLASVRNDFFFFYLPDGLEC